MQQPGSVIALQVSPDDDPRASARKWPLRRAELDQIVAEDEKQRYALDETGRRIRACQGHSLPVDLGLAVQAPPAVLYHGTAEKSVRAILEHGLQPRSRQHVHRSPDVETATHVGRRHGHPVVLAVDAAAMQREGHPFYRSENGVWLTASVPPQFLSRLP